MAVAYLIPADVYEATIQLVGSVACQQGAKLYVALLECGENRVGREELDLTAAKEATRPRRK